MWEDHQLAAHDPDKRRRVMTSTPPTLHPRPTVVPPPPHHTHTHSNCSITMVRSAQILVGEAFQAHVAAGGDATAFNTDSLFEGVDFSALPSLNVVPLNQLEPGSLVKFRYVCAVCVARARYLPCGVVWLSFSSVVCTKVVGD
eukprot:m.266062 g.266062  ORF g.266062 m.266062 type:complete len:143 (-) comp26763_c4_seq1:2039-2467(-)